MGKAEFRRDPFQKDRYPKAESRKDPFQKDRYPKAESRKDRSQRGSVGSVGSVFSIKAEIPYRDLRVCGTNRKDPDSVNCDRSVIIVASIGERNRAQIQDFP